MNFRIVHNELSSQCGTNLASELFFSLNFFQNKTINFKYKLDLFFLLQKVVTHSMPAALDDVMTLCPFWVRSAKALYLAACEALQPAACEALQPTACKALANSLTVYSLQPDQLLRKILIYSILFSVCICKVKKSNPFCRSRKACFVLQPWCYLHLVLVCYYLLYT